jgi:hypothetical protein
MQHFESDGRIAADFSGHGCAFGFADAMEEAEG